MVSSLFKKFSLLRYSIRVPFTQNLCFLQLNHLSTSSKGTSKSVGKDEDKKLYTMNYLVTTLGFSPERAQISCKSITFETPEKPDSVISFLRNHGFTKTQISKMANLFPLFLVSDPEKTLLPKIEFLKSLDFSTTDVASILTATPRLFHRSVEKQLMPSARFLSSFLPIKEEMLVSLKRCHNILLADFETSLIPNINYMKNLGVPQWNISKMVRHLPRSVSLNHDQFKKIVDDVKEMGFNPMNFMFVYAIHVVYHSKRTWQTKMQVYKSWGFSQEEILQAFQKNPHFLQHSPQKITDVMHYLVNKMGFKNSVVIHRPQVMTRSLQKTIIPRCSVYQILSDKKLVPRNFTVGQLLDSTEKKFLNKFVEPFEEQVPGLLMLYKRIQPAST